MYFVLGKESVLVILVYSNYFALSRSLPSLYLSCTFGFICVCDPTGRNSMEQSPF
jgi:hypothetical protein